MTTAPEAADEGPAAPRSVLVVGATGFVGGAIAAHLVATGHIVSGVARTDDAAELLRTHGLTPVVGDLDDRRDAVLAAAAGVDAVVYAAQVAPDRELTVVDALLVAVARRGAAFLFGSGTGVHLQRTGGAWSPDSFAEDDPVPIEPLARTRHSAEQAVRRAADSDTRTMVLRPGLLWGPGDHGRVSEVYRSVARTGAACYVGEGLSTYTHVHVDDFARLCALALAHGQAGGLYHSAAGEVPDRWIAEAVARDLGVATRSLTPAEAVEVWGEFGALIMTASSRSRDPRTRAELGWAPTHTDLLTTVGEPRLRALAAHKPTVLVPGDIR